MKACLQNEIKWYMWGFPCNHCFFFFFFSPPVSILVANKSECHRIYRASFVLFKKKKKILFTIILIKIFSTSKYLQRCFFFFFKGVMRILFLLCVCVCAGGGGETYTPHTIFLPSHFYLVLGLAVLNSVQQRHHLPCFYQIRTLNPAVQFDLFRIPTSKGLFFVFFYQDLSCH